MANRPMVRGGASEESSPSAATLAHISGAGAGNWAAIAALVVFDTLVTVAACRYFFRHT